jgi:hypothetical protein
MKTPNSWRSTGVQPLKIASHWYAASESFSLMEDKKSSTYKQAPNFIVFNLTIVMCSIEP